MAGQSVRPREDDVELQTQLGSGLQESLRHGQHLLLQPYEAVVREDDSELDDDDDEGREEEDDWVADVVEGSEADLGDVPEHVLGRQCGNEDDEDEDGDCQEDPEVDVGAPNVVPGDRRSLASH